MTSHMYFPIRVNSTVKMLFNITAIEKGRKDHKCSKSSANCHTVIHLFNKYLLDNYQRHPLVLLRSNTQS